MKVPVLVDNFVDMLHCDMGSITNETVLGVMLTYKSCVRLNPIMFYDTYKAVCEELGVYQYKDDDRLEALDEVHVITLQVREYLEEVGENGLDYDFYPINMDIVKRVALTITRLNNEYITPHDFIDIYKHWFGVSDSVFCKFLPSYLEWFNATGYFI